METELERTEQPERDSNSVGIRDRFRNHYATLTQDNIGRKLELEPKSAETCVLPESIGEDAHHQPELSNLCA